MWLTWPVWGEISEDLKNKGFVPFLSHDFVPSDTTRGWSSFIWVYRPTFAKRSEDIEAVSSSTLMDHVGFFLKSRHWCSKWNVSPLISSLPPPSHLLSPLPSLWNSGNTRPLKGEMHIQNLPETMLWVTKPCFGSSGHLRLPSIT